MSIEHIDAQSTNDISNESFKITAVGDGQVGKTCLLTTFAKGEFPKEYVQTIFDNYPCRIDTRDGSSYNAVIWDTAGQEEYDRLRPLSYPGTSCFLLCFSISSMESYKSITNKWVSELKEHCPGVPIILVGTKSDLRGTPDEKITRNMASKLRRSISAVKYLECSAKENEGLNQLFSFAVKYGVEYKMNRQRPAICSCLWSWCS